MRCHKNSSRTGWRANIPCEIFDIFRRLPVMDYRMRDEQREREIIFIFGARCVAPRVFGQIKKYLHSARRMKQNEINNRRVSLRLIHFCRVYRIAASKNNARVLLENDCQRGKKSYARVAILRGKRNKDRRNEREGGIYTCWSGRNKTKCELRIWKINVSGYLMILERKHGDKMGSSSVENVLSVPSGPWCVEQKIIWLLYFY